MERILIVEDEEKLARFLELELRHEGYAVEKAFDGRSGLAQAEEGGFDLILLDVMLPQLSGLELLRRLRRTSQTPVIMLTARDAVMDKVTGLDMGADDYITKPFEIEELLARIRVALRKHGVAVQLRKALVHDVQIWRDAGIRIVSAKPVRQRQRLAHSAHIGQRAVSGNRILQLPAHGKKHSLRHGFTACNLRISRFRLADQIAEKLVHMPAKGFLRLFGQQLSRHARQHRHGFALRQRLKHLEQRHHPDERAFRVANRPKHR